MTLPTPNMPSTTPAWNNLVHKANLILDAPNQSYEAEYAPRLLLAALELVYGAEQLKQANLTPCGSFA